MTDTKRPYHAPHRQRQAQATRERIAASARRLFARDGYGATTIQAIAAEAGVAVQTVYATFGSKRAILLALLDAIEAESGLEQLRDETAAAASAPARQIREWVAFSRRLFERGADVIEIARTAGSADSDVGAMGREGDERRREGARSRIRSWVDLGLLRPDLDESDAVAIVWTLLSPEVFRLLVRECGWTGERYEAWLVDELEGLLVEHARSARHG